MASREFSDSEGVVWRVWDVTPTHLHPATRGEEYMEPYAGGWLTFESPFEKRRLVAPYPSRWPEFDLKQMETLCMAAQPVRRKHTDTPSEQLDSIEETADKDERADNERTFTSPRGRLWTVRRHECLHKDGGTEIVLRFTAGDAVVDLREFPEDWRTLTRLDFALLLLDAQPPRRRGPKEHPQRRREDRPEE